MNKQIASAALTLIGALAASQQGSGNSQRSSGKRRGNRHGSIPKDAVDLHGETHDGIVVNSPKGQFLKGDKRVKLFTTDGKFAGVFDEQGLIEIEAGARTARAMLIAKKQPAASQ